jgi:hypothetical protein
VSEDKTKTKNIRLYFKEGKFCFYFCLGAPRLRKK